MVRTRLASLGLATTLLLVSGCCWNFPVLNRVRTWWHGGTCCHDIAAPCCDPAAVTTFDGPVLAGPHTAPVLPENGIPPLAPPPRVVPVPQSAAPPIPYTPSSLLRRR
jgi:hypothetical protein